MVASRDWVTQEAVPADGDFINTGPSDIREGKQDVRERMGVDHVWAGDSGVDGRHIRLTLTSSALPTRVTGCALVSASGGGAVGNVDVWVNTSSSALQLTRDSYINMDAGRLSNNTYLIASGAAAGTPTYNILMLNTGNTAQFAMNPICTNTNHTSTFEYLTQGGAARVLVDGTTLTSNSGITFVNIKVANSGISAAQMGTGSVLHYLATQIFSGNASGGWATKSAQAEIGGAYRAELFLKVKQVGASLQDFYFRRVGDAEEIGYQYGANSYMGGGCGAATVKSGNMAFCRTLTDDSGYFQWKGQQAEACTIELMSFLV